MAVRFYLPSTGTSPLASLAVASGWSGSVANFGRGPLERSKATNTALSSQAASFLSTANRADCWRQWTSEPLTEPYSFTGSHTASLVMRCVESASQVDAHIACVVRVVSGDGATVRGTLLSHLTTSTEYSTTASTRILNALTLSAVSALAGDRIVVELGSYGVTPSTAGTATLRYGTPTATSDFALTANLTTDLVPWLELSATPNFDTVAEAGSASVTVAASGAEHVLKGEDGTVAVSVAASGADHVTKGVAGTASVTTTAQATAQATHAHYGAASVALTATGDVDTNLAKTENGTATLAVAASGSETVTRSEAAAVTVAVTATAAERVTHAMYGAASVSVAATASAGLTANAEGTSTLAVAASAATGLLRPAAGAVAFAVAASGVWALHVGESGRSRFFVTASTTGEVGYEGGIPPQYLQSFIYAPGVLNYGR